MEKSERDVNKRQDKHLAVEKWLDEAESMKGLSAKSRGDSRAKCAKKDLHSDRKGDTSVTRNAADKPNLVDCGDRLELHGQHIRLEYSRDCSPVLSETETELTSIQNVLPKVYLTKKVTKHVQFKDQVYKNEGAVQLHRNMTNFLALRENKRAISKQKPSNRSQRYVVSPSNSDIIESTREGNNALIEGGSNSDDGNEASIDNLQPPSSRQKTMVLNEIPSILNYCKPPIRLYKRLKIKSSGKSKVKDLNVNTRSSSTGEGREHDTKNPIIRGLVVDTVDNQKPSIVRASHNANIREEFALKQKVASYRHDCHNRINTINHAQRRLGANLAFLRKRLKIARIHSNRTDHPNEERSNTMVDNKATLRPSSDSVELFIQCKGYVPSVTMPSKAYSFPALIYPKRKTLTVKQCA